MLSRTAENYLRAIYEIFQSKGYVRVRDISSSLSVKASTTVEMLEKLHSKGLVNYQKREGVALTEEGIRTASVLNSRYKVFLRLFELAGVSSKTAYKDACLLEHYISDETNRSIQLLVEKLERSKL